jgi:hypothetical protein
MQRGSEAAKAARERGSKGREAARQQRLGGIQAAEVAEADSETHLADQYTRYM